MVRHVVFYFRSTRWSVCYLYQGFSTQLNHLPTFINYYYLTAKTPYTRVIQKVLLCTKYYVISNAYPYLVHSNLFRKVS